MNRVSVFRHFTMSLTELEDYHRKQRKYSFERGKPLKHIRLRKGFQPVFVRLLAADRLFRKQTITILGKKPKSPGQVIYACTHIAKNDLENIYEVLGKACWWFIGDPCILYKSLSGLLLYLNGQIFMEVVDRSDRNIAYLRAVELLKKGGSLMIFPEGARNGSENLPVMPLFSGTAKMSLETHVPIVPVAIEEYNRKFIIKFGQALLPEHYCNHTELTRELRDALATLKWDIWESEGLQARSSFSKDYSVQFIKEFEKGISPWDTLETIERARFHTKEEAEQREAFAHLAHLVPSAATAFLLRDKLSQRQI